MRACRFSSATPSSVPANRSASVRRYASKTSSIGTMSIRVPSRAAQSRASSTLAGDEYGDGIASRRTASGPSASVASVATSAESIPPDIPMTTSRNPFFRT